MKRMLGCALLLMVVCGPAFAQRVATGVSTDTIRVGDPFRAVVRIDVPPGTEVVLPDSLPASEDIENAGRVRMRRDSTENGVSVVAAYPLTAWRPGKLALPSFRVLTRDLERERALAVDLPGISVMSVLPADTTDIEAKPPKDVLGPNRIWWLWLLAALLLLAAVAAAYWWYQRRRSKVAAPGIPVVLPRARALEELERMQQLGLVERGEFKLFYIMLAEILRHFMESHEPAWSRDLTTEELAMRLRKETDVAPALEVLRSSDLVKFARARTGPRDANGDWQKARDWLVNFRPEPVAELEAA